MTEVASPTISELGPLGVRLGDDWSPIRGRRAISVVALLSVARGRVRTIDELVEAGWSGPTRPPTARQSLANVVMRLRQTHGPAFISSTGHGYQLGSDVLSDRGCFLDLVDDARTLAPVDRLTVTERALQLWHGPPWVELDDIDELRIDQSRLVQAHVQLRALRAAALTDLQRHHEAVAVYTELVEEDPTNETAWNGKARALGATGRRVEGLRVIDRARHTLAASGLLLGSELLDTERELLDVRSPTSAPSPFVPNQAPFPLPRPVATRPTLVIGRDDELLRLDDAWRSSTDVGQALLVAGDAGVGKTTLITEFANRVAAQGGKVLHGASDDVTNMAFQPYVLALDDWRDRTGDGPGVDDDRAVLSSAHGLDAEPSTAPTLLRVVDAIHRSLSRMADSGRTLLVLEDLHWATPETILATRSLIRRVPRSVMIVITSRRPTADLNRRVDALFEDARRIPSLMLMTIDELDAEQISTLVTAIAPDADIDASLVAEVVGGNPLLISEYVTASLSPSARDAVWSLADAQLMGFTSAERHTIELAAVLGEEFWAEDLAAASGRPLEQVLRLLGQGAQRRLLSMTDAHTWRFRHALVRDAVLNQLDPRTRAEHHFQVANTLATQRRPRSNEVAQHFVASVGTSGRTAALCWLRRAALESTRAGAHEQAARCWEQVIELDRDADARTLIEAHMARGTALVAAGYWERSHEPFELAAALAVECGDQDAHADAAIAWVQAPENYSAATRLPDFILATRDFLDELDASRRAHLAAILAIEAIDQNRFDECRELIDRARIASVDGTVETRAFVERARFRTWWDPDRIDERYRAAVDLVSVGRRSNSATTIASGLRWQAVYGLESGRLQAVRSLCQELVKHGNRVGDPFHAWFGWSRLAVVTLALGSPHESRECLDRADDLAAVLDTAYVRSAHTTIQLGLQLHGGRRPTHLDELVSGHPGRTMLQALADERLDDARRELMGVEADRLAELGQLFGEMPGTLFWAPLALIAAATNATEHAAALLPLLEPSGDDFAVQIPGASFEGALALHVGLLRRCLGDLDGAVAELGRAIVRNDEVGARIPSALCRWQLAVTLALRGGRGDPEAADAARRSAEAVAPDFDLLASPLNRSLDAAATS